MSDDLVKEHGTTLVAAVIGLAIASAQWLLGREIKRRDLDISALKKAVHEDHEVRLRTIEIDHVKRSDIAEIHSHLNAMRSRAEERHLELLDRINT